MSKVGIESLEGFQVLFSLFFFLFFVRGYERLY